MKNQFPCCSCGKAPLEKNIVALNKKILGRQLKHFYCISCLADYLELTEEELLDKIEDFKNEGCALFS